MSKIKSLLQPSPTIPLIRTEPGTMPPLQWHSPMSSPPPSTACEPTPSAAPKTVPDCHALKDIAEVECDGTVVRLKKRDEHVLVNLYDALLAQIANIDDGRCNEIVSVLIELLSNEQQVFVDASLLTLAFQRVAVWVNEKVLEGDSLFLVQQPGNIASNIF